MEYEFNKIINRIMSVMDYTHEYQVAELLGFKRVAFSERKKRNSPPLDEIIRFCSDRGISPDWLLFGKADIADGIKMVPVYGTVPAGWPDEIGTCEEKPIDWIPVEGSTHGIGGLRVEGHSMSPEIRDGEFVLYALDTDLRPGDWIIASDEFNRPMVKEYAIKNGEPWLVSINPEYPSFKVNCHYRIIGRVLKVINSRDVRRRG